MPHTTLIDGLAAHVAATQGIRDVGRVARAEGGVIHVGGLSASAAIGDRLRLYRKRLPPLSGEVVQIDGDTLVMLPDAAQDGVTLGDRVSLLPPISVAPSPEWLGRIIDPSGQPLDGAPLLGGPHARPLKAPPPNAAERRGLGKRMSSGLAVINTFLPIVEGQRMGLFAGSGVGKSSLLGHLARHMKADVVVIAMIGERGRELRHFVDEVLGGAGLERAVVVAATSDQSALVRRRCAWTAMAVAEHFRDAGHSVLLLADSITRFAEAHREIAVAAGEVPLLRGFPPSLSPTIMSLCERAGPGLKGQGDITAVFSVLVAGSDMDEPVADILRGVLDGHVILDRTIAEKGRYPAIDILRSVSRSLPGAATDTENTLLATGRKYLSLYDANETMIRAGLYAQGSDPELDKAILMMPELEEFFTKTETEGAARSFQQLELIFRRNGIVFQPT
ncbi:FliI/YscN family ATPase [Sulfitobacter sp. S190]|uniref:FliI/YscN family ATPase n=1 Tax=Sulfitobacter sp. S190 TaxID=2867022 RepID=UPI0021A93776|nr:FliI/YscN family ATPase [Sulfitobacter sp. S190]UWR24271.1 FliI/YscN family ATPase [Sulfitobacter sp. S190]